MAAPKRQLGSCGRYSCEHTEVIGAALTTAMLEAAAAGALQVRFSGDAGAYVATVAPEDARRQLAAVRQVTEEVKTGSLQQR